ncbi:hypothetical protein ACHAWF_002704, partial [Thalassiosira exigua]
EKGAGKRAEAGTYDADGHSNGGGGGGGLSRFLDMMCSDNRQVDSKQVESHLKGINVLLAEETVELAFRCGRDSFVMTSHRILKIDVQGMSGTKVEYYTLLWPAIKGYSVETAGNFLDRDSELTLYFNLPNNPSGAEGFPRNDRTRMKIDFRSGSADLMAVQRFVSDKLLGPDVAAATQYAGTTAGLQDNGHSGVQGMMAWAGDDNRLIDAEEANRQFHSNPPLLQNCERVELAFKGRRDMMLFTTKRVVFVDVQGLFGVGKKVEYTSVPWSTVTAFSVRSAGSLLDKDSEMCLWLDFDDVFNPMRKSEDDPQPPPIPRKSWLETDFQKDKVDTLMIHRYLSERLLKVEGHNLMPPADLVSDEVLKPLPPGTGANLLDWIRNNASAVDAEAVNEKFHESGVLQNGEKVAFAFKNGRDSIYLTNKRILVIDVQRFCQEMISVPMDMIRVWSVESAGSFDRDMELRVWFKGFWNNKIKQDLRKGRADIFAIQTFIAHFVIGSADGKAILPNALSCQPPPPGAASKLLGFLGDAHMKDPFEVTTQLRSSPALLQKDESVDAAFKAGRDSFLVTTKRIIIIDTKGSSFKTTSLVCIVCNV